MLVLVPKKDKDLTCFSLNTFYSCSIQFQVEKILVCTYGNSQLVKNFKTINFYLFLFYFVFYCDCTLPLKLSRVTGF